jgi:hypothetical protein
LHEFLDVMPEKLPDELPPRRRVDHAIEMMLGVAPPAKAPYQISHEELKELKVQLEELLAKRYIKLSKSPYGAPFFYDAPPSSLMDSITSPKVKTTKGKGVGVCSLARSTSEVEGCAGASGWDWEN